MSLQGVIQLQRITVGFCRHRVSSAGVRAFIKSRALESFARDNPKISIQFVPRNGHEPTVTGEFCKITFERRLIFMFFLVVNGRKQVHSVKMATSKMVMETISKLKDRTGRSMEVGWIRFKKSPSIQGKWDQFRTLGEIQAQH
jgi:hypothetical protein